MRNVYIAIATSWLLSFSIPSFAQKTECGKCIKNAFIKNKQCVIGTKSGSKKDACKKETKKRLAECKQNICEKQS